ncbi:MAG: PKD domain-containing protein [Bacteroidales bacterium]|nr:PKD domain-containing protein [Bacteroidales bacterium]
MVMKKWGIFFSMWTLLMFGQAPGCPYIDVKSMIGNSGVDDTVLCGPTTITLKANYLQTGSTNTYSVSSIPFNPPYPVSQGNPFSIGQDDIWSSPITLPFNFCFFGGSYNKVWVGSNGVITLTDPGSTFCPWSFSSPVPSASLIKNAVFGVYHDLDPRYGGSIRWAVLGSYPCRTFVFNFDQVPHYSCNSLKSTSQVVLYEGTNVIEVYVFNKPTCTSWNSGNAVIGIQNSTGSVGFTPPGRNTGPWSATNEAWRFTPAGPPNFNIAWYENGNLLGYGPTIQVTPTTNTEYIGVITYENCDFSQYIARDTFRVTMKNMTVSASDTVICEGENVTLRANGLNSYQWSNGQNDSVIVVSPTSTTTYTVTGIASTGCTKTASITILVNPKPAVSASTSTPYICGGDTAILMASGADTYLWSTNEQTPTIYVSPQQATTYYVTGTNLATGCTNTASVNIGFYSTPHIDFVATPSPKGCEDLVVSFVPTYSEPLKSFKWSFGDGTFSTQEIAKKVYTQPGNYSVRLDVVSNNDCPTFTEKNNYIEVYPLPIAGFSAEPSTVSMDNPTVQFIDQSQGAFYYFYFFNDVSSSEPYSSDPNPIHVFSSPGSYNVMQVVTSDKGCKDTAFTHVEVMVDVSCYIPSAFTPHNQDGLNDVFKPVIRGLSSEHGSYLFYIYNRWGNEVFKTSDPEEGWDGKINGKLAEPGVYHFYIKAKFSNGLIREYRGSIHIMR